MTRIITVAFLIAFFAFATPVEAERDGVHGRFAIGGMKIDDSGAGDFDSTSLYYRVTASKLTGLDNISFNLDGNSRYTSRDYNRDVPEHRLLMANVKISGAPGGKPDLTMGRTLIEHVVGLRVDGADLRYRVTKNIGGGVFGGLRADPYKDGFNADYGAYGGYLFAGNDIAGASGGYSYETYKGAKDRERASGSFHIFPYSNWISLAGTVEKDHDAGGVGNTVNDPQDWEPTNILLHGTLRPVERLSINLSYNDFRAINRDFAIKDEGIIYTLDRYTVTRAKADFRITRALSLYGGGDRRYRKADSGAADQVYAGLKCSDFYYDTHWDARYSDMDYFTARVRSVYVSAGILVLDKLNADAGVTWLRNSQSGATGDMEQWIYEISFDTWMTQRVYALLNLQYSSEKYLDINSIYTSRYSDNYSTTSIYGQVGYKF